MKKQIEDFVKSIGGTTQYSGKTWPAIMYINHPKDKQKCLDATIKHFGRHTQISIR